MILLTVKNIVVLALVANVHLLVGQSRNCTGQVWSPPRPGSMNSLGEVRISGQQHAREITVSSNGAPLRLVRVSCAAGDANILAAITFQSGTKEIVIKVKIDSSPQNAAYLDFSSSQAVISSIDIASWPEDADPQLITVPYYSFPITQLGKSGPFSNAYWDWTASNATRITLSSAEYKPLTDGRRNPLGERLVLRWAAKLNDTFPLIPNPKSPYMATLSGRAVLDFSGRSFDSIASTLDTLRNAGLKNCVVLIHSWQHQGYDNGLPGHLPANESMGGDTGLIKAIRSGQAAGCFVGLHENYVDYYPNFEGFDPAAIALDSNGQRQTAYYNPSVRVQSFATRPSMFVLNATRQSPDIHQRFQTNGSFIDVNSSAAPWFRSDMDAASAGGGMFSTFFRASASLWDFERKTHGGPVFGEGKEHWYWSGLLDGVEAQFGAGDVRVDGPEAPLFVDFDILRIHPLQVNHGMGLYERWVPKGQDIRQSKLLDAYRMQEIIYGHAPFLGGALLDDVGEFMLQQNLVGNVAKRYGTETASSIRYQVGDAWVDGNVAVSHRDWSRVQVQYNNGDIIVANSRPEPLAWQDNVIPENGWVAIGQGLLAYTSVRNGHIVDYAQTSDAYFANSRNQSDFQRAGLLARVDGGEFKQTADRRGEFRLRWTVIGKPVSSDNLDVLVHFIRSDGTIAFQADHTPSVPTTSWVPGQAVMEGLTSVRVPPNVPDGTYSMRIGLYSPVTSKRTSLLGQDDGSRRYLLGDFVIANGGKTLEFQPRESPAIANDQRLNASNSVVDFGPIQTDGMVSVSRNGLGWRIHAYPTFRDVVVQLNATDFPVPPSVTCNAGARQMQLPELRSGYWTVITKDADYCDW